MLTNVEIDEFDEMVELSSNIYEGNIYREKFNCSPIQSVIVYLNNLKLNFEEEGIDLMVHLRHLTINSFYGQSTRQNIDEEYIIKSENWLIKITMNKFLIMNP